MTERREPGVSCSHVLSEVYRTCKWLIHHSVCTEGREVRQIG